MENSNNEIYIFFSDEKKCKLPQCIKDLLNLVIPIVIIVFIICLGIWIFNII